jgi:histidine ammonia-lyase
MHELQHHSFAKLLSSRTLLLLSLALIATGCKPQDDATLTQSVQGKLASDTSLGSEPVQVSVQQGVATLNGTVNSDAARSLAANDAAQVVGIRTVVNNLVIQPSAAVANLSTPPLHSAKATKPERRPPLLRNRR